MRGVLLQIGFLRVRRMATLDLVLIMDMLSTLLVVFHGMEGIHGRDVRHFGEDMIGRMENKERYGGLQEVDLGWDTDPALKEDAWTGRRRGYLPLDGQPSRPEGCSSTYGPAGLQRMVAPDASRPE